MSQSRLAELAGMTKARVSDFLSGKRDIYVETLQRVLQALELEIRPSTRGRKPMKGADPMFVVFEDLDDATETKIHKAGCPRYLGRRQNAPTTRWHGPFDTFEDAAAAARSIAEQKSYGVKLHPACCWRD